MLKVSRVFFIIILISFLLIINCCSVFATDINMNLVPETPAQEQNSDANTDNANQIDSTTPQTSTENNSSMLNPNIIYLYYFSHRFRWLFFFYFFEYFF